MHGPYKIVVILVLLCAGLTSAAQFRNDSISLKDSLDRKFDLSDYIIKANGFVPVPILITEPALGGFGAGIVPVFLHKRNPYIDSSHGKRTVMPVVPDITGAMVFYTANKTWGAAVFRSGTFVKSRIKYMAGGGYANVNISFYHQLKQLGEKEFRFRINTVPLLLQATRRIGRSNIYAGLKYVFLKADVAYVGDTLFAHEFVKQRELNSIVSQLGVILELDSRDNIFTPDKGIKVHYDAMASDNILGSDYDYWHMNYYMYAYKMLGRKVVTGLRIDGQQALGDPPFFLLPFIDMRGVPAARYQGNADLLAEGEVRWDLVKRWSLLVFGGAGKAFDKWSDFGSADWVGSYGTGFRYLLARKFKLRVGIDVARGPGTWAYYIVFGSNWLK